MFLFFFSFWHELARRWHVLGRNLAQYGAIMETKYLDDAIRFVIAEINSAIADGKTERAETLITRVINSDVPEFAARFLILADESIFDFMDWH